MADNKPKASLDALYSELFEDDCSEEYPEEYLQLCPASAKLRHGPTPAITGLQLLHSYLAPEQQVCWRAWYRHWPPFTCVNTLIPLPYMQEHYLRMIDRDDTIRLTSESNQAMRFGTLPSWALELATSLPSQCFPDEVRTAWPPPYLKNITCTTHHLIGVRRSQISFHSLAARPADTPKAVSV